MNGFDASFYHTVSEDLIGVVKFYARSIHAVDQDDELGPGTTEGLTGKVEEDRNIRTVGDLWRRLSGSEKDKKRKR